MALGDYILNVLVAIDRVVNAALRGDPDETLSSVAYRNARDGSPWGFWRKVIDGLFFWQPEHCKTAYDHDRKRVLKN